jgi:hypothetical protein
MNGPTHSEALIIRGKIVKAKKTLRNSSPEPHSLDRWLTLLGLVCGIIFALITKTGPVVVAGMVIIFTVLVRPIWRLPLLAKSKTGRIVALLLLVTACIALGRHSWPNEPPLPIRSQVHVALVCSEPGLVQMFMYGRWAPTLKMEASPVPYLLHIEITNPRSEEVTITRYKIEASNYNDGPWTLLIPIDMDWPNSQLYTLPDTSSPAIGTLKWPTGSYRFSPRPPANLGHASRIALLEDLDSRLRQPLQPKETIYEWEPFSLGDANVKGVANFYRITLNDSQGEEYSEITPFPHGAKQATDTREAYLTFSGVADDIASYQLAYYQ